MYKKVIKNFLLIGLMVFCTVFSSPSTIYAASSSQREDVLKNSPEHDGDNSMLDACSANKEVEPNSPSGPGKVFMLGDSIGVGISPTLGAAFDSTSGWSFSHDSKEGRQLAEGLSLVNSSPQGLQDSQHILIVLGANTVNASKEDMQGLVDAIRSKNDKAKIYWLGLNLTRSDLTEPSIAFNTNLKSLSNSTYIENGVAPTAGDGVHHTPDGYSLLGQYVAGVIKGGGNSNQNSEGGGSASNTQDLNTQQKVAKLIFIKASTPDEIKSAAEAKVGGIFVRNSSNANDSGLYNSIKTNAGSGSLIAVDYEGGRVQAPGASITGAIPSAAEMGLMDELSVSNIAKDAGKKLADLGINMDFAPVLDIAGNNSAVIGDRAFSNTPSDVSAKAGAFADGLRSSGITPVFKHFPGHGSREGDSHTQPVTTAPLAELEARDIIPYRSVVTNPKSVIMVGHLKVPEWGETPTSLNSATYQYIRDNLNFDGLVITDSLDMNGISTNFGNEADRAVWAIAAGADMALINNPAMLNEAIQKLSAAVEAGSITNERLNESASKVQASIDGSYSSDKDGSSCSCYANDSNIGVDKGFSLGTDPKGRRVALMRALINDLGLTPEQAAGMVGNFLREAGGAHLPPDVNEGTSTGAPPDMSKNRGYGWAQWTHINGSRKTQFIQFALDGGYVTQGSEATNPGNGEPWTDDRLTDAANYAFLKHELSTSYTEALEKLRADPNSVIEDIKSQGVDGALDLPITDYPAEVLYAWSFHNYYEGSADSLSRVITNRGSSATQVLAEYNEGGGSGGGGVGASACSGTPSIVGNTAFPLIVNKSGIENRSIFADNTTASGGHGYTAYDIHTPVGVPVVTFLAGKVTKISEDSVCGGGLQSVQIFTKSENKTTYYTHLKSGSVTVSEGSDLAVGTTIAQTNSNSDVSGLEGGCSIAHLHIDVVTGEGRPGCSRDECPSESKNRFVDIGPELYKGFEGLEE